jgi:uncharacterized membrane protein YbhN (UPF0104 family)
LAGIVVSAVLLGLLFWRVDVREVAEALAGARLGLLVAAACVYLCALFGKALRWGIVLGSIEHPSGATLRARRRLVVDALFLGFLGNYVLPARLGELARAALYSRKSGVALGSVITTIVFGRLLDAIVLAAMFFGMLQFLPLPPGLPPWVNVGTRTVGGAALVVMAVLLVGVRWLPTEPPLPGRRGLEWLWDAALRLGVTVRDGLAIGRQAGRASAAVLTTFGIWIVEAAAFSILLLAFGHPIPIAGAILQMVGAAYASAAPSAPGALGIHQWVTVLALAPFGVPETSATAASLVATGYVLIWTVPFGLLGLWRQGGRLSTLVQEAEGS